jgi:hypothetical protein
LFLLLAFSVPGAAFNLGGITDCPGSFEGVGGLQKGVSSAFAVSGGERRVSLFGHDGQAIALVFSGSHTAFNSGEITDCPGSFEGIGGLQKGVLPGFAVSDGEHRVSLLGHDGQAIVLPCDQIRAGVVEFMAIELTWLLVSMGSTYVSLLGAHIMLFGLRTGSNL